MPIFISRATGPTNRPVVLRPLASASFCTCRPRTQDLEECRVIDTRPFDTSTTRVVVIVVTVVVVINNHHHQIAQTLRFAHGDMITSGSKMSIGHHDNGIDAPLWRMSMPKVG